MKKNDVNCHETPKWNEVTFAISNVINEFTINLMKKLKQRNGYKIKLSNKN